jgi:hypothetical protein
MPLKRGPMQGMMSATTVRGPVIRHSAEKERARDKKKRREREDRESKREGGRL